MYLSKLGFNEAVGDDDAAAILVGPNGSGKSIHLQKIATHYKKARSITIVSNTCSPRLSTLRGVNKFSMGRGGLTPKTVIKNAVAKNLDKEGPGFYHISTVLEYCRYRPRFGFRIEGYSHRAFENFRDVEGDVDDIIQTAEEHKDFETARRFLEYRRKEEDIFWIDASSPIHEFSQRREFAAALRMETALAQTKLIKRIRVYLQKADDGAIFEMQHASSGELSLISSLIFLSSTVEHDSIVLIDEPENSLHPSWQRQYVSQLLAALAYRNVSIVIATHSPLLVTGAIMEQPDLVSVFQMHAAQPRPLKLDGATTGDTSIEGILWKAFDIVTPANHFVSEELVESINMFENDEIPKSDVLSLIDHMREKSFDRKQTEFFQAVTALVDDVEKRKNNPPSLERPTRE
jgi:predicted ATPase